jgi:hypothetical protein
MISIDNLINELKISKKIFIPSIISEINIFVSNKILGIYTIYKSDLNKYILLGNLANLGLELENIINLGDDTILSIQLNFFNKLLNPIINRIRNICLEINLELIDEYKNLLNNLIELEPIKYKEQKKNIKFLQINCFCRNINYIVGKETLFGDFGITIKITNYHFKDIFKNLITSSNLFVQNNNNKDKRFDWFWKAIEHRNNPNFLITEQNQFFNYENINNNLNEINKINETNETNDNNDTNEINEFIESYKIIQKIPDMTKSNQISNIFQELNIIKPTHKEMSKIISNSIIIEDESFSIPIDNIDNIDNNNDLTTISNNF